MIQIRLLNADDAEAYWAIRLEALEEVPRAFGASAERHRTSSPADMVERLTRREGGSFIVGAFAEGELVGTAGLSRPEEGTTAFVWGVYVSPNARGLGLGAAMFETLLERARSYHDLTQITLDCFGSSLAALSLYRKLRFDTVAIEPNAIMLGDEEVDLHHMRLLLR